MADCVQSDLEKQVWGSVVESVSEDFSLSLAL